MEKEFVPYTEALALKELGFDEPCFGYWKMSDWLIEEKTRTDGYTHADQLCSAPLYQQAFRWFREKYQIISEIRNWNGTSNQWYYMIHHNDELLPWRCIENTSYEEAELACLVKLIEIVKNNE
jgi:hypothetical protein